MRKVLTFLSDFGSDSPYPAAMKAAAAGLTEARFIDISHQVRPQNIREGAFLLWSVAPYFPSGTVHCAVVDPGVGTGRAALIITSGEQYLVGPDNGLLLPAAHRLGRPIVYQIAPWQAGLSPGQTFDGRDLFAPVAARLSAGAQPEQLAQLIGHWQELDFGQGSLSLAEGWLKGQVIYVDHFGNLVTNISAELVGRLLSYGERLRWQIEPAGQEIRLAFQPSFGFVPPGEPLAYLGSAGTLELALREGNAAERFQVTASAEIRLRQAR